MKYLEFCVDLSNADIIPSEPLSHLRGHGRLAASHTEKAGVMLDLGWSEILIIGVVALIVVGPKDLPKMLRTLGQYAGRAKSIAREFQRSMDDAARQADQ